MTELREWQTQNWHDVTYWQYQHHIY